jgi:Fe2+ or Zn2+ uptake regulation protein
MPNCPRCSQGIKSLKLLDKKTAELELGEGGVLQAIDNTEQNHQHFYCPKCGEEIETLMDHFELVTRYLKTGKMF